MKICEALAAAVLAEGCTTVFGLLGDANLSFWGSVDALDGISLVSARHEAAAVAMADGYFRTTGEVGVATITSGPGLTQIGTSLMAARDNHSAIVVITGDVAADDVYNIQKMDQKAFSEASGAVFVPITGRGNLAREIVDAFYLARTRRCPVVLNLPSDVAGQQLDWDVDYVPSAQYLGPQDLLPAASALERLTDTILAAERIVLVAGHGARSAGAREAIVELGTRTGALLATSLKARGYFLDEPFDIGIAGSFACAAGERVFLEADLVIGIGAGLGYYTTEGGLLFPEAKVVRIDAAPRPDRLPLVPGDYLCGDAKATIEELNRRLDQRGIDSRTGFRTEETRRLLAAAPEARAPAETGIDPRELARSIGGQLAKDTLLTVGAGHFWSFVHLYLPAGPDVELHLSYQFGAIGQTLPIAIGISTANRERPQLVIEGDGSVLMHIQEFDTAVREGIPLVLLIWNDGGYGAEFHKFRAKGGNDNLGRWSPLDFVAIARSFGGDGARVEQLCDLAPALDRGFQSKRFFVIDARVSDAVVSDPFLRLQYGEENRTPRLTSH